MFNNTINKLSPLDTYNTILVQFQTIKNSKSFINYTLILPTELLSISNIVLDTIEKLSELSSLYIKKHNEFTISVSTLDKIKCMYELHNELLVHIYNFAKISSCVVDGMKDISMINGIVDFTSYIYYDIINRHKLIILQIFDTIKKINVYCTILKDTF